jgi:regulatory protein
LSEQQGRRQPRQSGRPAGRKSWLPEPDEHGQPAPLSAAQVQALHERAHALCVWHLARSGKTRAQLARTLAGKQVPAEITEAVLDHLVQTGLLDDAAFADGYVRSRGIGQRHGTRRLQADLRRKGVAESLVEQALEQVDPGQEQDNARALVQRRLAATAGLDRNKRTQRLVGMLARRGYPTSLAFEVVRQALADEAAGEDVA